MAITSVLSNAFSGLHKNAERIHQSANKIVNINSNPVVASPVSNPQSLSGGNAVEAQLASSDSTDLLREFVNIIEAETAYKANAEVMRVAESLSDYTRDILA